MPEGPEILRSADVLNELLTNAAATDVFTMGGRYATAAPDGIAWFRRAFDSGPMAISRVQVHGKFMWWEFRDHRGAFDMWCTYGMTGQWVVQPREAVKPKHAVAGINLVYTGGREAQALFVDPRHFGTIKFTDDTVATRTKVGTLGPDMLSNPPEAEAFLKRFQAKRLQDKGLGVVLLDQRVLAGVGNYIRAEALYLSALSPFRNIRDVSREEFLHLREAIIQVMTESYACNGATFSTFATPDGHSGLYKDQLRVYRKECDPEGRPVVSSDTADGRTIWWVPSIQV